MSHSRMLKARRTKQRTRKQLAGVAKRAKKQKRQEQKALSANAAQQGSA